MPFSTLITMNEEERPLARTLAPPARRQTWLQAQGWENGEMKGQG